MIPAQIGDVAVGTTAAALLVARQEVVQMSELSLADTLSKWRGEFAKTYKRYAGDWSGESYSAWAEYPPIEPYVAEGNNARTVVQVCDWMLWLLKQTHSAKGYNLSDGQLRDFAEWFAVIKQIEQAPQLKPMFNAHVSLRDRGRRGANTTNEKRRAKLATEWAKYRREVKALMDSGLKYTPACEQVAEKHDCDYQTVRKHTAELRPGQRRIKR